MNQRAHELFGKRLAELKSILERTDLSSAAVLKFIGIYIALMQSLEMILEFTVAKQKARTDLLDGLSALNSELSALKKIVGPTVFREALILNEQILAKMERSLLRIEKMSNV